LSLSISVCMTVAFVLNSQKLFDDWGYYLIVILFISILMAFYFLHITRGISLSKIGTFAISLIVLPTLLFLCLESLFIIYSKTGDLLKYKWVFIGLTLLLSIFFFFLAKKRGERFDFSALVEKVHLPFTIVAIILACFYHPFIDMPVNLFEYGNPLNAQMRMWQFGELPFIDFLNSHMLSEIWHGLLFFMANGYSTSLDFMTYDFLNLIITFLLSYYFLRKCGLSGPRSFLILLLFPYPFVLLNKAIVMSFLSFILYLKWRESNAIKDGVLFVLSIVFVLFWRVDAGVALLFTMMILMPILRLLSRRVSLKIVGKSLVITAGIGLSIFIPLLIFFGWTGLFEHLPEALGYLKANQAHGYSHIAESYDNDFILAYVLMPFVAVLALLYVFYRLWQMNESEVKGENESENEEQCREVRARNVYLISAGFLLVLFLMNAPRGLVRHGFAEGVDSFMSSTFYLGMGMVLLLLAKKHFPRFGQIGPFFIVTISLIIIFKHFPLMRENASLIGTALSSKSWKNTDLKLNHTDYRGRVIGQQQFIDNQVADLKEFTERHLRSKQTFIDFSNSPELYFFLNRRVPSYFCQSLQNTVDDDLQLAQMKDLQMQTTPMVVYSTYPPSWYDATDGVPNALRQYLLAEYIYTNYTPFRVINGKSVWLPRLARMVDFQFEKDTLAVKPVIHDYGHIAHLMDDFFFNKKKHDLKISDSYELQKLGQEWMMESNTISESKFGVFMRLEFDEVGAEEDAEIHFLIEEELVGSNTFKLKPGKRNYLLRASNHYRWHLCGTNEIRVIVNGKSQLLKVQKVEDLRYEYR
jgi:hypothetical protein